MPTASRLHLPFIACALLPVVLIAFKLFFIHWINCLHVIFLVIKMMAHQKNKNKFHG